MGRGGGERGAGDIMLSERRWPAGVRQLPASAAQQRPARPPACVCRLSREGVGLPRISYVKFAQRHVTYGRYALGHLFVVVVCVRECMCVYACVGVCI